MDTLRGAACDKRSSCMCLLRLILTLPLFSLVCFSSPVALGFVALSFDHFLPLRPAAVASLCRIISSSVDIRSAEVCELGLLNFKAKNVLYRHGKNQLRCRHDYYWASVFEVEYRDIFSGKTHYAYAEAPKEALPLKCRPNFGVVWLTKGNFKVNVTYDCRYTPGYQTVDIHSDSMFGCEAENPSTIEMLKRINLLFESVMNSIPSPKAGKYFLKGAVTGVFSGVFSSIGLMTLFKLTQGTKLWLVRKSGN